MISVCYYVTGHGYGHATRSVELISGLVSMGKYIVHIVSTVPEHFFLSSLKECNTSITNCQGDRVVFHHHRLLDAGAVQADVFKVGAMQSLVKYHDLFTVNRTTILTAEVEWLKQENIQLVLIDATSLGCMAGRLANAKVVLVTNFTWDFVYREMLDITVSSGECPAEMIASYRTMIEQCSIDGSQYDLFIQYPGKCPTDNRYDKSKMIDGPLITRRPLHSDKVKFRAELGLIATDRILLLGFGGHDMSLEFLEDHFLPEGWICLLLGARPETVLPSDRFRTLGVNTYTPDIINIADVVLGKLGYGFVSECINCGTPLIFVPRIDWPEQPYIQSLLCDTYHAGISMPLDEFKAGQWGVYLDRAYSMRNSWSVGPDQSCDTAVEKIIGLLETVLW